MHTPPLLRFILLIVLSSISGGTGRARAAEHRDSTPVIWTMVDVTHDGLQGDAHLLEFPNGQKVLIDLGDSAGRLLTYLRARKLSKIDDVFITHAHRDHYGGLRGLIEGGIRIGTLHFSQPDRAVCEREKPWGCDYNEVVSTLQFARSSGITVKPVHAGEALSFGPEARLEVLYAFDGPVIPLPSIDINDMSLIMKLTFGRARVLFTGDLNDPHGRYLALNGRNLEADILKVPHHGAEKVAPNQFLDRVGAKQALVPAPASLWLSDRSSRIRNYFANAKVPVWISGIHGDVKVTLSRSGRTAIKPMVELAAPVR